MKVSAKELRTEARRLLESVERGEEVIITYRGVDRARVVPLSRTAPEEAEDSLFGIWEDRDEVADAARYVRALRRPRRLRE